MGCTVKCVDLDEKKESKWQQECRNCWLCRMSILAPLSLSSAFAFSNTLHRQFSSPNNHVHRSIVSTGAIVAAVVATTTIVIAIAPTSLPIVLFLKYIQCYSLCPMLFASLPSIQQHNDLDYSMHGNFRKNEIACLPRMHDDNENNILHMLLHAISDRRV